jgi:type IV pilus assembly protein PilA
MKFKDNIGFTLIELLVVVAIIGILAAVGIVYFGGFTAGAKASAVKANHAQAVKFISSEIKKCEISGGFFKLKSSSTNPTLTTNLSCSPVQTSTQQLVSSLINHLNNEGFKNPYNEVVSRTSQSEVFFSNGQQQEAGQAIIKVTNNNIIIITSIFSNSEGIIQTPLTSAIKDER